jgi:hypothetical protein
VSGCGVAKTVFRVWCRNFDTCGYDYLVAPNPVSSRGVVKMWGNRHGSYPAADGSFGGEALNTPHGGS